MPITFSTNEIGDDGGTEILVTSTDPLFPETAVLSAKLIVGGNEYPCWHHSTGKGALFRAETTKLCRVVCPPVQRKGDGQTYQFIVHDEDLDVDLVDTTGAVFPTPWKQAVLDMRQLLRKWDVGYHTVDTQPFPDPVTAVQPTEMQGLEAVTSAIGEMLNEMAGVMFTRLVAPAAAGDPEIFVETTFGWPAFGFIIIGDRIHAFGDSSGESFEVVHYNDDDYLGQDEQPGTAAAYPVGTPVYNLTGNESDLAALRANLFVDFATGEHLDVLGRNIGVKRPAVMTSDNDFRRLIKALAYGPRGTMFGLERVCDVLFGSNNYELYEVPTAFPCTVFLRLTNALRFSSQPDGRSFMTVSSFGALNAAEDTIEELDVEDDALVYSVKLAVEDSDIMMSSNESPALKPSDFTEVVPYGPFAELPLWAFAGIGTTEGSQVSISDARGLEIRDTSTAANTAFYERTMRLRPESVGRFGAVTGKITTQTSTDPKAQCMVLEDGERRIAVGMYVDGGSTKIGFFNFDTGAIIGTYLVTAPTILTGGNNLKELVIVKNGREDVRLLVAGRLVMTCPHSTFPASSENRIAFGCMSTTNTTEVRSLWHRVFFHFECATDFANVETVENINVDTETIDDNGSGLFATGSTPFPLLGSYIRVVDGNPEEQGVYEIYVADGVSRISLRGLPRRGGRARTANPDRFTVPNDPFAFTYPNDVGRFLNTVGAAEPGNVGVFEVLAVLDPDTFTPLSGTNTQFSSVVQIGAPELGANEDDIPWQLGPLLSSNDLTLHLLGRNVGPVASGALPAGPDGFPMLATVPVGYVVVAEVSWSAVPSGMMTSLDASNDPVGSFYPFYMPDDLLGAFRTMLEEELTVAGVILELELAAMGEP